MPTMKTKNHGPSLQVVAKYSLLQLPALAVFILALILLRQWLEIPSWLMWGLPLLWIAKDVGLFPFLWRAYDDRSYPSHFEMVGRRGIALTRLDPEGHVQVRGERWRAAVDPPTDVIDAGASVTITAIKGLKLTVKRF